MATVTSSTNQTTPVTTPAAAPKLAALTGAKQMGRDDFLQLLVTQLKNQDPLKPTDNTEFVAQLAQFSQLDQSTQQVQLLQQSISNQNDAMEIALLPMVGRDVQIQSSAIQLRAGSAPLHYALDRDAVSVRATIVDQSNKVVKTVDLSKQGSGKHDVTWDGKDQNGTPMPDGVYQYQIDAEDATGAAVPAVTTATVKVTGIRSDNGKALLVSGDLAIDRSAIIELR